MVDVVTGGLVRTFLIADVRGYTRFTVEHGDAAAARLAARFAAICQDVAPEHSGEVVELRGDEALIVFTSTRAALLAASDLQSRFTEETLADASIPLQVGIGLDAGEAIALEGGFRGAALNLAARLCSLAGPGEILVSEAVAHLARRVEGLEYVDRAQAALKGFSEPVRVFAVRSAEVAESPVLAAAGEVPDERPPLPIGGFLGSLPSTPLAAREEELTRLVHTFEPVLRSEGRLIMLAGEPGVGKTRLAQEATLHLRNAGFAIAAGSCFEARQTVPYYPFLDVVSALYGEASSDIRAKVPNHWSPLAHLLPEVGIPLTPSVNRQEEQERLFRAFNGFVAAVAAEKPVALLLDDLHWADHASLDLLQHLARHTRGDRVLILGTYRDVEVNRQHPLEAALLELGRHGLVQRIPVRRLDRQGTVALMEAQFSEKISDELARLIYENTEGNPFFTHEVLRALIERGDIYRENGRWERLAVSEIQVPESVRAAIGQRLSRLQPETQELLHQASVFGQRFHFDDLLTMVSGAEDDLERALEEASVAGLLRDVGGDVYGFEHALTHQALYGELSPRRRRRLHLAVGEALEAMAEQKGRRSAAPRSAELAWHFLQAEDDRALAYAIRAGDEAEALYAHDEADAQYSTAVELAQERGDQGREAEASEKLAQAAYAASRLDRGLSAAKRAMALYRELGDEEGERRAAATFVSSAARLGRHEEGMAQVDRLLTQDLPVTPGAMSLLRSRSLLLFTSMRLDAYVAEAPRLLDFAQRLGEDSSLAHAAMTYGLALQVQAKVRESVRAFEEAVPLAEKVGDPTLLSVVQHNLADGYRMLGQFPRALSVQERAVDAVERSGDPGGIGYALAWRGHILTLLGRWKEARVACERGVAMFRDIGDTSWFASYPVLNLGSLDQLEGRPEADDRLRRAFDMAVRHHDGQALSELVPPLALAAMLRGQPQMARDTVERAIEGTSSGAMEIWFPAVRVYSAWAEAEMGEMEAALQTLEQCLAAHVLQLPLYRAPALWVLGRIRGRVGAFDAAESAFEEALTLVRHMPWPFAEGFTLYEYGRMEQECGGEGIRYLQEALSRFQMLGAQPYIRLVQETLDG